MTLFLWETFGRPFNAPRTMAGFVGAWCVLGLTLWVPHGAQAQLRGAVRTDAETSLCAAVQAELRAIGVSVVTAGPAVLRLHCESGVLIVEEAGREERFVQDEVEELFAARIAELLRARLLVIPAPPQVARAEEGALGLAQTGGPATTPRELTGSEEDQESVPDTEVGSGSPSADGSSPASSESPESLESPESPESPESGETTERDVPNSALLFTTAVGLGGMFSASSLIATPGLHLALGLVYEGFTVRATAAGFALGPEVTLVDPVVEGGTLNVSFVDIALDASYVGRVASTPLFIGGGAGISVTRLGISAFAGTSSEMVPFQVLGGETVVWTGVPYLRAEVSVELAEHWHLRAATRVGVFGAEIHITLPFHDADEEALRIAGWVVNTSLELEARWDV